jgi:hypothetical protein
MLVLMLFWIGGVLARYGVAFAVDKTISVKKKSAMAICSAAFGILIAYLFNIIGAHGGFANIAMVVLGFMAHFGVLKLYKIKNQA